MRHRTTSEDVTEQDCYVARCEEEGLVSALPNTTKSGLNKNVQDKLRLTILGGIFSVLLKIEGVHFARKL